MWCSVNFLLKIRRAETPFFRTLRQMIHSGRSLSVPVPRGVKPLFRSLFLLQQGTATAFRWLLSVFVREPFFRGRCVLVGKRFRTNKMPFIVGHAEITIGDD